MADGDEKKLNGLVVGRDGSYGVLIPCPPEEFGDFISGLLGKPQTIERTIRDNFILRRKDVSNLFHLVDQRVSEQNEAALIQFAVKIIYDDSSSVLLNSLPDFERYEEITPKISISVNLSWSYLITFRGKRTPEKQTIDITFYTHSRKEGVTVVSEDGLMVSTTSRAFSAIHIQIAHTNRTWGVDLESLLTGHVKGLLMPTTKLRSWVEEYSGTIGFACGALFFLIAIAGLLVGALGAEAEGVAQLRSFDAEAQHAERVLYRLNILIDNAIAVPWTAITTLVAVVVSMVVSVVVGTWVSRQAENRGHSFVLMSTTAIDDYEEYVTSTRYRGLKFAGSFLLTVAGGVIANLLFAEAMRWLGSE